MATVVTSEVEGGVAIVGAASHPGGPGRYLLLQSRVEPDPDDWGVHVELDSQSRSGCGGIAGYTIDEKLLVVTLDADGRIRLDCDRVEVELDEVSDEDRHHLEQGLLRVLGDPGT